MTIFEIAGPDGTVYEVEANSIEEAAAAVGAMGQEDKPWHQRLKENLLGDDDPTTQNFGEKVGSVLNKAGEAMTFGLIGDEASAAVESVLPGVNYADRRDHYRQQERVLEQNNPGLALGAELGGAVAGIATPLGTVGTLGKGASMAQRMIASALAGSGMGGVYGFAEGEGIDDRLGQAQTGALIGGAAGAAAPVVASGVEKVANKLIQRAPIKEAVKGAKTAAQQRAAAGAQYKAFDAEDVQMSLPAFRRMTGQVDDAMRAVEPSPNIPGPLGKPSKSYSNILKSLNGMGDIAEQAGPNPGIRLSAVEDVRKAIGPLAREMNQNFRPTQGAVSAQRGQSAIDAAIDSLQPEDLVAGDKDAAVSALKKARELWRTSIKTQKVENAIEAADDYLSGTASGIRNQFKSLLRRDRKEKLFTEAERAFLKKAIGGNMLSRAVRLAGDGIGRRMAVMGGGLTGGPMGAAVGAGAGELAAQIGDNATRRNAELARALVASGGLNNLPTASPAVRQIAESLARRIGVAVPQ